MESRSETADARRTGSATRPRAARDGRYFRDSRFNTQIHCANRLMNRKH
ncbi:hypothetical protein BURMUCF2_3059 [Burkholderia multivorans CF2]|nr:hypothetical protein BURMUCF2_3059 [Burkholderia multivorans CF2]